MAKVQIEDQWRRLFAEVDNNDGREQAGLVVATRPLKEFTNVGGFFLNDEFGFNMNQDASSGGTPDNIHNGVDNTYWTGSSITGSSITFNSTTRPDTGTNSVYHDRPVLNELWQYAKGSDVTMSTYTSLVMRVNIDSGWTAGDELQMFWYDSAGAVQVGDAVQLEDYIDINSNDVWQTATIPLSAFGVASSSTIVDALRFQCTGTDGTRPRYYIDNMLLQETGEAIVFTVEPESETYVYIDSIKISMAATYDPTLANSAVPKLPYDSFLGVTLTNGILYQRSNIFGIDFAFPIRNMMDIVQFSNTEIASGTDGTTTWLTLDSQIAEPFQLKAIDKDQLTYTITEDLSVFDHFRVSYSGRVEKRPLNTR